MAAGELERDCFKEEFKRFKKKSTDLREVLDIRDKLTELDRSPQQPVSSPNENYKAEALGLKLLSDWQILSLPDVPGLLLLPDLFLPGGQHHWVRRCLVDYPCKPNICNLDAHLQRSGRGSLWPFGSDDAVFTSPEAKKLKLSPGKQGRAAIPKDTPLYRLRWVTLGYHYNWDTKEYSSERRSPFPSDLCDLSAFILRHAGFAGFKPEAAIVNYYHLDSSLSGHTDHSEKDLTQPLLSVSFGQSAIFLIGGKSKQTKPTAILLRSGDVVIMSKDARLAYHGVPRILAPSEGEEVPACLTTEAIVHGLCGCSAEGCGDKRNGGVARSCANCSKLASVWTDISAYLSMSRINVNVRQVVSDEYHF